MIIGDRKSLTENGTVTSSVMPYFLHRRVAQGEIGSEMHEAKDDESKGRVLVRSYDML
jgi:hypothetical protein